MLAGARKFKKRRREEEEEETAAAAAAAAEEQASATASSDKVSEESIKELLDNLLQTANGDATKLRIIQDALKAADKEIYRRELVFPDDLVCRLLGYVDTRKQWKTLSICNKNIHEMSKSIFPTKWFDGGFELKGSQTACHFGDICFSEDSRFISIFKRYDGDLMTPFCIRIYSVDIQGNFCAPCIVEGHDMLAPDVGRYMACYSQVAGDGTQEALPPISVYEVSNFPREILNHSIPLIMEAPVQVLKRVWIQPSGKFMATLTFSLNEDQNAVYALSLWNISTRTRICMLPSTEFVLPIHFNSSLVFTDRYLLWCRRGDTSLTVNTMPLSEEPPRQAIRVSTTTVTLEFSHPINNTIRIAPCPTDSSVFGIQLDACDFALLKVDFIQRDNNVGGTGILFSPKVSYQNAVSCLAWHPNGQYLYYASDNSIFVKEIYDYGEGRPGLRGQNQYGFSKTNEAYQLRMKANAQIRKRRQNWDSLDIKKFAISPDGSTIVVALDLFRYDPQDEDTVVEKKEVFEVVSL
jgi:WD40 repeat protein